MGRQVGFACMGGHFGLHLPLRAAAHPSLSTSSYSRQPRMTRRATHRVDFDFASAKFLPIYRHLLNQQPEVERDSAFPNNPLLQTAWLANPLWILGFCLDGTRACLFPSVLLQRPTLPDLAASAETPFVTAFRSPSSLLIWHPSLKPAIPT